MAYAKRVAPIKLVLSKKEYNLLVGILTENIENDDLEIKSIAVMTKEKLLKFGIPKFLTENEVEIEIKLYINEAIDIITQLLMYCSKKTKEIDFFQALIKVRECININDIEN